jgi:hypothetical protein
MIALTTAFRQLRFALRRACGRQGVQVLNAGLTLVRAMICANCWLFFGNLGYIPAALSARGVARFFWTDAVRRAAPYIQGQLKLSVDQATEAFYIESGSLSDQPEQHLDAVDVHLDAQQANDMEIERVGDNDMSSVRTILRRDRRAGVAPIDDLREHANAFLVKCYCDVV